jgi:hypothetical protein
MVASGQGVLNFSVHNDCFDVHCSQMPAADFRCCLWYVARNHFGSCVPEGFAKTTGRERLGLIKSETGETLIMDYEENTRCQSIQTSD